MGTICNRQPSATHTSNLFCLPDRSSCIQRAVSPTRCSRKSSDRLFSVSTHAILRGDPEPEGPALAASLPLWVSVAVFCTNNKT